MDEPKLNNCPFCANQSPRNDMVRTGLKVKQDTLAYLSPSNWIVLCLDCGASGANHSSADEAIAAWNTRTPSPAAEQMYEVLQDVIDTYDGVGAEGNYLRESIDAARTAIANYEAQKNG